MTSTASSSSRDNRASVMACLSAPKSRTSYARNQDFRSRLFVATWNVLTLNLTGYMTALVRTLHERYISLIGVTEASILCSDISKVEDYTILNSVRLHHVNGVALVISAPLTAGLMNWCPISNRLLRARFAPWHGHTFSTLAYALIWRQRMKRQMR